MVNPVALHINRQHPDLRLATLIIAMLLMSQFAFAEGSRIVKWKDEKGVTHYGDKIPTQYSNTESSVMNKQGVTVKRNKPTNYEEEAINQEKLAQDKKDRALLAAFSHEDEIDLARDRNLQLDQLSLEGLELQKANHLKRHAEMLKFAENHKKKKQAIPEDLSADIQNSEEEKLKINSQIEERKALMVATRKRFDDDKARYIALKIYANGEGRKP
jgi:hypothetical protein